MGEEKMVSWIAILVIVALIALLLTRRHRFHTRFSILFVYLGILFLVFSIYVVYISQVDFTKLDSVMGAMKVYITLVGNVVKNLVQITGYAIQQNWSVNVPHVVNSTIVP